MAKQGRITSKRIRDFVIKTKEKSPRLSQRDIADRVESEFGGDAKIDKSTVGIFLRSAGFVGRWTSVSDADGPLAVQRLRHEQDGTGEIRRLKTQVTKAERKSLRPSGGIEGKIHEALRQHTSDGELPIFLGDYDTALGVYVEARLGVARDLYSEFENLRKEPKLRVDLTKWDVDLLDTL